MHALSAEDAEHRELFRRNVSVTHMHGITPTRSSLKSERREGKRGAGGHRKGVLHWGGGLGLCCTHFLAQPQLTPPSPLDDIEPPLPPRRLTGDVLRCHRVSLDAPDGTPLVRELSFEVSPGRSAMIMGQNGSGKSSLFRVRGGGAGGWEGGRLSGVALRGVMIR